MVKYSNTSVILVSRPEGKPRAENFKVVHNEVDTENLKEGQILVKTYYLSLDPYLIGPMGKKGVHGDVVPDQAPSTSKQFKDTARVVDIDAIFGGRGVGRVVRSKHPSVKEGDFVAADWKWTQWAIVDVDKEHTFEVLEKDIFSDHDVKLSWALGVLSVSGSHVLWGFNYLCNQDPSSAKGKTLVVSSAGGSFGVLVGQLAKIYGIRTVGIAGGKEKCERLEKDLYDTVVDYQEAQGDAQRLTEMVRKAVGPDGADFYFDNTGGLPTEAVNPNLKDGARVYFAGAVAEYPSTIGFAPFGQKYAELYKEKNITWTTCMHADYIDKIPQARRQLYQLIKEGKLKPLQWVVDGIEKTPEAFQEMYEGKNFGKSLVRVFDE